MIRASIVLLGLLVTAGVATAVDSSSPAAKETQAAASSPAVYIAYYWRAKPGQLEAYNEYIKTVAEPIDEEARRAGVFEEVRTVVPAPGVTVDWTHLRRMFAKSRHRSSHTRRASSTAASSSASQRPTSRTIVVLGTLTTLSTIT